MLGLVIGAPVANRWFPYVAGVETRSSARVLRPMAGLSYFYAL